MCSLLGVFIVFIFAEVTHTTLGQYASQCNLPNEQTGLCMPVYSCKSIYELLTNIQKSGGQISDEHQNMLNQRYCGFFNNMNHVCCPEADIQLNTVALEILLNQTCGKKSTDKVSFGDEAPLFSYPWMAVLVYNDTRNPYRCAGSLISDQYILTAAHCIRPHLMHVRLGEHRLSTEIDCIGNTSICAPPVENIGIEAIIVHANFVQFTDDIALIRLKRKVQFQDHIKPICLPIFDNLRGEVLKDYIISGWGRTDKELSADVLMVALVPHVPLPECQAILRKHRLRIQLTESIICAGNTNLVDVCDGDSGGPLGSKGMYRNHPRIIQRGIVSFGALLCGDGNAPNAYTNVSHYIQWITDNMRK